MQTNFPIHIMYNFKLLFSIKVSFYSFYFRWICSNSVCSKSFTYSENQITYQSQNECRLSCAMFGALWPHPTGNISISHNRVIFNPFVIRANIVSNSNETNKFIGDINKLFLINIAKECINNCSVENSPQVFLKLSVYSKSLELNWNTNESYTLRLRASDKTIFIDIKSETVFGARHGLETLSNLITANGDGYVYINMFDTALYY